MSFSFIFTTFLWACLTLFKFTTHTLASVASTECPVSASWSLNTLDQTPCEVFSKLTERLNCSNETTIFKDILKSSEPSSPLSKNLTGCLCNTVRFSLFSACQLCLGGQDVTWQDWQKEDESGCSTLGHDFLDLIADSNFVNLSLPVPNGVDVPPWSFLPLSNSGTLDITAAQVYSSRETKGAGPPPNSMSISKLQVSTTETTSDSMAPDGVTSESPPMATDHKRVAALVGGIVGGAVGVAFVFCIVVMVWKVKRGRIEMQSQSPFIQIPSINYPPLAEKYSDTRKSVRASMIPRLPSFRRLSRSFSRSSRHDNLSQYEVTDEEMRNFPRALRLKQKKVSDLEKNITFFGGQSPK